AQIFQSRDREVPFGPGDYFLRHEAPRSLLEDMLAASAHFQIGRNARRELYKLVVQKRNATLQAPSHRHVVDTLHRVVDEHDLGVELQSLLDGAAVALREEIFDKL